MRDWWTEAMGRRPAWMNVLLAFCAYMAFVYVPWDFLVKPVAVDREAWFGLLLSGWAAKATEPLHWAIYAAGAWGFWKMRPWLHPWAALYTASIAVGMLVWSVRDPRAPGLLIGLAPFAAFGALAVALWRARERFESGAGAASPEGAQEGEAERRV